MRVKRFWPHEKPPMTDGPPPPELEPTEIARLEMMRMARVRASLADDSERFGGIVCAWSGAGSWNSEADGWSPDTPTTRAHLEGVIDFFAQRDHDATVTIAPHLDAHLIPHLDDLGFRLRATDLQYVIDLEGAELEHAEFPHGVRATLLDAADEEDVREWSALTAHTHFNGQPSESDRRLDRRVVTHPQTRCFFLETKGERIALGGVEVCDALACLFMGGVLEPHRNRGLQLALIRERLIAARDMGARYAIIGSLPGSPTERNALRAGMRLVFPKLEFTRTREGA